MPLMSTLETVLTVKAKEDLANAMVSILHKQDRSAQFLTDIVVNEVQELDNDTMAFRGNSLATKAMECFLKLVGEKVSPAAFLLIIPSEKSRYDLFTFSSSLCALSTSVHLRDGWEADDCSTTGDSANTQRA